MDVEGKSVLSGLSHAGVAVVVAKGLPGGSRPLRQKTQNRLIVAVPQARVRVPMPLLAAKHLGLRLCDGESLRKDRGVGATHLESDESGDQLLDLGFLLRHGEMAAERRVAPPLLRLLVVFKKTDVIGFDRVVERLHGVGVDDAGVSVENRGARGKRLVRVLKDPQLPRKVLRIPEIGVRNFLLRGKDPQMDSATAVA